MCQKFLIISFFSRVQKRSKMSSNCYIDNYLLRQYLGILTHPIIHFFTFLTLYPIFLNISPQTISHKSQWGDFNPQTPLSYASVLLYIEPLTAVTNH